MADATLDSPSPQSDEMTTVSFRISSVIQRRIEDIAVKNERTFSQQLRTIIRAYLLEEEREKAHEYLTRVRDED